MGSVPLFQNPYGRNGNSPSQIDQVVGTAYEVVREVGENLEYIKHVSAHMVQIFRVAQSTDGIDLLYTYIEELAILLAHIEEVLLVSASLEELLDIHAELAKLLTITDNITQLADLHDNLDEILSKGGTVIVSETPPTGQPQGRLWWENDSGNLFAWYDDGTSGQWVQINIASTSYDWTDILNKPSNFPPANHTHAEDVKKTGDTMTGNLTIAPPVGDSVLFLDSVGDSSNYLVGRMTDDSGVTQNRWQLTLGNRLAESGGATGRSGSDFAISRYTNAGQPIDSPLHIPRASGIPNFVNGLTTKTPLASTNDTTVATTAFVKGQINSFSEIVGNKFTVGGLVAVYVPSMPEVVGTSMAYGDGLQVITHTPGSTEGMYNLAVGPAAMPLLTTGNYNTSVGVLAGYRITSGGQNTGIGRAALTYLRTGHHNTALGSGALVGDPSHNGSWYNNTGIGVNAPYDIKDTAVNNTGVGFGVLSNAGVTPGLSGSNNSALGTVAMHDITSGSNNVALGFLAMGTLTTGHNNIGIGYNSGTGILSGTGNVIIGFNVTSLAPTMSNSIILAVGNGTRVLTGDVNGVSVLGTQYNSVPLAGYVGEYLEIVRPLSAAVPVSHATPSFVAALALTPGDWDVFGWLGFQGGNATTLVHLYTSLTLAQAQLDYDTAGASSSIVITPTTLPPNDMNYFKGLTSFRRMSISSYAVVYLNVYAYYSGSAPKIWGKIWARRMR